MPTPNFLKYSTTPDSSGIKAGNYTIGVFSGGTYGPTLTTNYWSGISPPISGYTIYENKSANGPSIRVPSTASVLIDYANRLYSGTGITTEYSALTYLNSLGSVICVNRDYEEIITSGLTMLLDAGFTPSYPRSGTTWTDMSYSSNNGTLTNGPVYSGTGGGTIVFDGVDDYINCGNSASVQIYQGTISAWVKTSSPGNGYRGIITKQGNYGLFIRDGVLASYDWGNNQNITTNINIADDSWKHVAMTFTTNTGTPSNNAIIYLNGSAVLTTTIKYSVDNVGLQIGNGGDAVQYISGNIAGASLYNRPLSAAEILQNYNAQKSRYIPFDTDAQAFITAAGITDSTQQTAINTLVVGLKADGLWTKMRAIYPFVGGTASTHKYNLKDPRDLNAAYRLQFNGGITHSSTGALPNGTNGNANTFFNPISLNPNSVHFSAYYRTQNLEGYYEFGVQIFEADPEGGGFIISSQEFLFSGIDFIVYGNGQQQAGVYVADNIGNYIGTRINGTSKQLYKNGTLILNTNDIAILSDGDMYLMGHNTIGGYGISSGTKQIAFCTIGDGLNNTESINLNTRITSFQTALSRQV